MSSNTFPRTSPFDLPETSITAGTYQEFYFSVYDSLGNPVNVSTALTRQWYLSYYGDDATLMTINGTTGSATNIIKFVVDENYTLNLSGKFVQQYLITDSTGKVFRPSTGVVNIYKAIS